MKGYTGAFIALLIIGSLLWFGFGFRTHHHPQALVPGQLTRPADGHARCSAPNTSHAHLGVVVARPQQLTLPQFAKAAGTRPSIIEYYEGFLTPLDLRRATLIYNSGAFPVVQWDPRVSVAAIANGRYDGYLRRTARAVAASRCPLALSFGHEMNGSWYPWGFQHIEPAVFVAAWRKVHDVFTQAGARNVIWAWTVIRQTAGGESRIRAWWPGTRYVNWIGIDGYYRGPRSTFAEFRSTFRSLRGLRKPVFLAETGVSPRPQEPRQISNLFSGATEHHVFAVIWFNLNAKQRWTLEEAAPPALAAFRDAARRYIQPGSRPG